MQYFERISNIHDRAKRIRLSADGLLEGTGIYPSTFWRWFKGAKASYDKVTTVEAALVGHEEDLLDHLIRLHPEKARAVLAEIEAHPAGEAVA